MTPVSVPTRLWTGRIETINVYAVDPGSAESAFVVLQNETILDKGIVPNDELLDTVRDLPKGVSHFAIERLRPYGFAVGAEIFDTIEFYGRCLEAACRQVLTLPLGRKQVCAHHRAKNDATIRAAMLLRLGKEKARGVFTDVWSALAVGLCAADRITEGKT